MNDLCSEVCKFHVNLYVDQRGGLHAVGRLYTGYADERYETVMTTSQ